MRILKIILNTLELKLIKKTQRSNERQYIYDSVIVRFHLVFD